MLTDPINEQPTERVVSIGAVPTQMVVFKGIIYDDTLNHVRLSRPQERQFEYKYCSLECDSTRLKTPSPTGKRYAY